MLIHALSVAFDRQYHSAPTEIFDANSVLIKRLLLRVNVSSWAFGVHGLKTLEAASTVRWNSVHLSLTPTTLISFPLLPRFTEVRTNGNSTWRTGSWTWTGETMSSPKPLGMPNGEVEKKKNRQSDRSRNSVTPSIQLTDTSISFHILWLDSFQETSTECLRTLTNPKDCEVP